MDIHHHQFPRITFNPAKCFGKACIRGLRIPVASLLSSLAAGMSESELLLEWPELEAEDVRQALAYAAASLEERVLFASLATA
ncbi:MAG TPA: DUF433 domain-containing protein [Thermoanaerobaculia bacterium]|nr:DUF433 domain-containing protein [Thermoanaerobaculia bacterium]